MIEDIYPMIFVLLLIGFLIDANALAETEFLSGSELRACDRYAVADQIMSYHYMACA